MMERLVPAVYEQGRLRFLEPVELEEGQIVHVPLPQKIPEQARQENIRELQALIAGWLAHPEEDVEDEAFSWEEFDVFLKANRFDLPERDLGLGDE